MKIINPENWKEPRGYANGVVAKGRVLFIAGQIGWNEAQELVSGEFVAQTQQALRNILAIVEAAGGEAKNLARMTWYVKDKSLYLSLQKEIGEVYQKILGKHFPAMSLFQVSDLLEEGALVEIEATAVLPQ